MEPGTTAKSQVGKEGSDLRVMRAGNRGRLLAVHSDSPTQSPGRHRGSAEERTQVLKHPGILTNLLLPAPSNRSEESVVYKRTSLQDKLYFHIQEAEKKTPATIAFNFRADSVADGGLVDEADTQPLPWPSSTVNLMAGRRCQPTQGRLPGGSQTRDPATPFQDSAYELAPSLLGKGSGKPPGPLLLSLLSIVGQGRPLLGPLQGTPAQAGPIWLLALAFFSLSRAFLGPRNRNSPRWGHLLDLPATHGTLGCVPEDLPGTVAAEVCVAAGDQTAVDGVVKADDTLLGLWDWGKGETLGVRMQPQGRGLSSTVKIMTSKTP